MLTELPIVDQDLLEKYYYKYPNNFTDALIYHTSGTTSGIRKKIYYSPSDHAIYLQQRKKIFQRYINNKCKVACSDLGTGHAADSATEIFNQLGLIAHKIDFHRPIEEHIKILNLTKPDVLFTMPVILKKLIHFDKLKIHPKKIFLVGDVATKAWQQDIADYFEINKKDIIDLFGSIEVGSIAFFNHELGRYQLEEHIIPESLSYKNHSLLVITTTARNYFPGIRYNTNDIIKNLHSITINGHRTWFFEQCLGRAGQEFKLGEKISFYDIFSCVEKVIPRKPFSIIEHNHALELLIPINTNSELIYKLQESLRTINYEIEKMITSGLVPDFKITRVPDEQLLNTGNFKRKILTPERENLIFN